MPSDALVALAERLQGVCLGRGLTVAAAESCTGGLIGAAITTVPGSSGYFLGAIVAYADAAKVALLDVPEATLEAHVSVTGIAGPDGGSPAKPVGLTYVALAGPTGGEVRRLVLAGDRDAVRDAAAAAALSWLVEAAEMVEANGA
jgi:nicotinamide mononucleotide (NMN) deamidase PncC